MTPEMRQRVRDIGLSARAFAAIVGLHEDTVHGWGRKHHQQRGIQPEPIWAWHLVRAWTRYPVLLLEAVAEAGEEVGAD
jgi:hypothetical protein